MTTPTPPDPLQKLAATYGASPPAKSPPSRAPTPPPAAPPPRSTDRQLSAEERLEARYRDAARADEPSIFSADDGEDIDDTGVDDTGDGDASLPFKEPPFKFAEGRALDPQTATALSEVSRELKLDNAAAQKIVDKMGPAMDAHIARRVRSMADGWAEETKADPEIGGARLDETVRLARTAVALGRPELRKLLDATGLGNHPEFVRWAAAIGRRLGGAGGAPEQQRQQLPPRDAEERLADTYTRAPAARPFTRSASRPTKSAEERLADSYRQH